MFYDVLSPGTHMFLIQFNKQSILQNFKGNKSLLFFYNTDIFYLLVFHSRSKITKPFNYELAEYYGWLILFFRLANPSELKF